MKAQVSVYIIIGIIIALLIIFTVTVINQQNESNIPQELLPVFSYYESCMQSEANTAIKLAGEGGGRVFISDYVPGSEYAPFASHLNFLGSPVKYWYSVEGNGLIKENIPSKNQIEDEISEYVQQGISNCNFDYFYSQGFNVSRDSATVETSITDNKVEVTVRAPLTVARDEESSKKTVYNIEISSKLGKFYNLAKEIYDEEKTTSFLEDYAVDTLYNYAPVSGIEIQCAPKIWLTGDVTNSIKEGLQNNINTIKLKGDYYKIQDKKREYFVHDKPVDESVNFLYSTNWPSRIEIQGDGVDQELMVSEAVGTQAGLGVLGFCYIPYHFVYDVKFPVLIQIYNEDELFQFPVVVIIDKNVARNAIQGGTPAEEDEFDLCEFRTKDLTVNLYDSNLNPVNGNVSFECFDQRCRLGETKQGTLRASAPACVNGYIQVRANGFAEKKQLFSTNTASTAEVVLIKEFPLNVTLKVGGREVKGETSIISFTKTDGTATTIAYPETKQVKLSEGSYEVKVYVYGNSSITIPASTKTQCVETPKAGLLGLFGSTKEECFNIDLPSTKIESALTGGGTSNTYILESELIKGKMTVNAEAMPKPTSLDALAQNFESFDARNVQLSFNE